MSKRLLGNKNGVYPKNYIKNTPTFVTLKFNNKALTTYILALKMILLQLILNSSETSTFDK